MIDPTREQRTLATAVGVVDRGDRGVVAVAGDDRLPWLHSITTQFLTDLPADTGTQTLVLSPHGHVEHDAMVADDGEVTWLDVEPGQAPALVDFLDRMRFLMKVEPRDATPEIAVLSLVGPTAPDALAALGAGIAVPPDVLPLPGPKFAAGTVPVRPTARYPMVALPAGGLARRVPLGVDLLVPRTAVEGTLATLAAAGVPRCTQGAYEAMRVAHRIPRLGAETDHRTIPHEVGWTATAVHLDKGCYRGQETVARVHNLGRPPRRLVLVHLDGTTEDLPAQGTPVESDGRQVGFVGTAVRHFELGPVALALVKRSVSDQAELRIGPMTAAIDLD